jgi:hypothetical protein
MKDLIDKASDIVKQKNSLNKDSISSAANSLKSDALNKANESAEELLNKLPLKKDPRLLRKEAEAEVLEKKAEAERLLQQAKEFTVADAKDKILELGVSFLPKPPKIPPIPLIDPRLLAFIAYIKLKNEIKKLKQSVSKQNLKKSKDTFKYPMKPQLAIPKLPKIPELPLKPPSLPALPTIPKVPALPKLPTLPKIG